MNQFSVVLGKIFRFFSSLKFAVLTIAGIAIALAAGTLLESYYDTRTASYFVYRAFWFQLLLTFLGINILFVALSRWPWRKLHIPFLLAHAGILILLAGSWITQRSGLDGTMRITEGDTVGAVDFEDEILAFSDERGVKVVDIPWTPPNRPFREKILGNEGLRVDRFIPHAEPVVIFKSPEPGESFEKKGAAIHFRMQGGPMKIKQEFWLWQADPAWSVISMGPARFILLPKDHPGFSAPTADSGPKGEALLEFKVTEKGDLEYQAISVRKEIKKGRISAQKIQDAVIDPDWKGLTLTVLNWVPDGVNRTEYQPSKIQYGDQAPPSAIRLKADAGGPGSQIWLGLGDQASMSLKGRTVQIAYTYRRVMLPFALTLDHFAIEHYEGSTSPSSYSSDVMITGKGAPTEPVKISMNEPLHFGGYTFYQASYIPESPRPVTSIFTVNRDPGRMMKYGGSLLIVLGSLLLFLSRKIASRKENVK